MSSDHNTPSDNPPRPDSEDATQSLPEDPGKTWVPQERDASILGQTKFAPPPLAETQPLATESFGPTAESSQAPPTSNESSEPPRRFGEYELLEQIGKGGMGLVYKARDCRLDRIVALKTLKVKSRKTEQQVERFVREAKAAARLDHPNIVPCYDSGEHDGWHYMTMAYVAGKSLQDRLGQGPLEPEDAARLVHSLAGAVAHAHHQGVIHRDIKPSNVLIDKDGRPRLTDFGIAKLLDGDLFSAPAQLTLVGQVLGTPGYMAPEQLAGRRWEVGESADIYALGGVLSAALTGQVPGIGDDTLSLSIPARLREICDRCLAHRPQDRYASADEVVSALDEFLKASQKPGPPVVPQTTEAVLPGQAAPLRLSRTGLIKATGFVIGVLVCSVLLATWLAGWWGQSGSSNGTDNSREQEEDANGNNPAGLAPTGRIQSRLDVLVKRKDAIISLESPSALPLEPTDQLEADVRVDRKENAFLYLVRIGASQTATLENGGRPISLSDDDPPLGIDLSETDFAVNGTATESLAIDREGPRGSITLLLLARRDALPDSSRDELNRVFQLLKVQEPVLANVEFHRFTYSPPEHAPVASQIDLQPLIDGHPGSVPTTALVDALIPCFDRIEVVRFPVPELVRPAQAQPASDRNPQP
jgi:serine/threonine protein kinase